MKTQNQHSESTEALPCLQTPVSRSRFVPMLFSTPMVQAILNGTKTETRRILTKETFLNDSNVKMPTLTDNNSFAHFGDFAGIVSKAKVGDIIWVRETFSDNDDYPFTMYKADANDLSIKWKPSLFMPKEACRIFLEIVSVSVERLQDIDEQGAKNEGIFFKDYGKICHHNGMNGEIKKCPADDNTHPQKRGWSYRETNSENQCLGSAKSAYGNLWQKINGIDSWDLNPFVWVYKFRSIPVPPDFC